MTGLEDKEKDENGGLYGPTESDIERFNREDSDYLDERKRDAKSALWKLIAGGVFMLLVASMFLNVLLPAFSRNRQVDRTPVRIAGTVTRVFDGRTIGVEIDGLEHTVRYIGVDTPVFGDRFYDLAIAANRQWIFGQRVLLEADELDANSEGHLLRYVWLDDAMVNLNLVAVGLSRAITNGPNDRYDELFIEFEDTAKSQDIGIWEGVEAQRSAHWSARSLVPAIFSLPIRSRA